MKHRVFSVMLSCLAAAFAQSAPAADEDTSRSRGVFDQRPECMDRDASNNPKCVAPSDQDNARVRAAPDSSGRDDGDRGGRPRVTPLPSGDAPGGGIGGGRR